LGQRFLAGNRFAEAELPANSCRVGDPVLRGVACRAQTSGTRSSGTSLNSHPSSRPRSAPFGFDPAFDQQFLQGGVERTFFDAELFGRQQVDALGVGRPYRHTNQLPEAVEILIVRLKKNYPTWGAPKIGSGSATGGPTSRARPSVRVRRIDRVDP
jgi:hypothetical protein